MYILILTLKNEFQMKISIQFTKSLSFITFRKLRLYYQLRYYNYFRGVTVIFQNYDA